MRLICVSVISVYSNFFLDESIDSFVIQLVQKRHQVGRYYELSTLGHRQIDLNSAHLFHAWITRFTAPRKSGKIAYLFLLTHLEEEKAWNVADPRHHSIFQLANEGEVSWNLNDVYFSGTLLSWLANIHND